MTIYGHHMTMRTNQEDSVRIAELKARLSEHLLKVRNGRHLTILDRNTPIARILPYAPEAGRLKSRKPTRTAGDVSFLPPLSEKTNSLLALREERKKGR